MLILNQDLKITDFGASKILTATQTKSDKGTPLYQPPEIINCKGHDFKSDIW